MSPFAAPDSQRHAVFPTTSWTLIRDLQSLPQQERRDLWETWLRGYWRPLYAFFRRHVRTRQRAEDLVQGFLQGFLAADKIQHAARRESRFRSWLLACARNYLVSEARKERAHRRRPPGGILSFQDLCRADGEAFEPAAEDRPDDAYLDAWRRELLDRALREVRDEAIHAGRAMDYEIFERYYLPGEATQPSWANLAAEHRLVGWKFAARKADWVKLRLARAIRRQVRHYVESDAEVDGEIRDLSQ